MRLAAFGIGMLIMLSGSVTGGLAGHGAESSPTVTLKTSTPSPSSSGQPTPPSTSELRRTSVTAVMNGDLLWHNTLWNGAREERPATRTWWL